MIILLGMWLCILYCIVEYIFKNAGIKTMLFFSFIIFSFCTVMGSDAGHIGLGMIIGLILSTFGIACAFEGKRRVNDENKEKTKQEIINQNKYDDDLGFNDFNK